MQMPKRCGTLRQAFYNWKLFSTKLKVLIAVVHAQHFIFEYSVAVTY